MMTRLALTLVVGLGVLASPLIAAAQQEQRPVARSMYYMCDQSREARADTIVRQRIGPVFDRHLAAGNISAWGWLVHSVGGEWRRAAYWVAADLGALIDASNRITEELQTRQAAAIRELNAICPSHEDYLWTSTAASAPIAQMGQERATASLSVYFQCDITREARADELIMQVYGPVATKHVQAGHIGRWSWISHSVGGELRRVLILEGPDHKSILEGRSMIQADMTSQHSSAVREFGQICPVHHDYLWNIAIAKP